VLLVILIDLIQNNECMSNAVISFSLHRLWVQFQSDGSTELSGWKIQYFYYLLFFEGDEKCIYKFSIDLFTLLFFFRISLFILQQREEMFSPIHLIVKKMRFIVVSRATVDVTVDYH